MKQLVRDPKAAGGVRVADVPEPALLRGTVLVRTAFSAISPGTERAMAQVGLSGAVRSVRERPDLVRRVASMARRDGVRATWERIRARLQHATPLGSSSSGVVLAASEDCGERLPPGTRVACTGSGHAVHAEVACVPGMLCVPIPEGVAGEHAAFGTLGAIALHAVRVARPELGERVAVLGLGLVGQLVAQVLRAHGARVAAFDPVPERAELAAACGAEIAGASGDDAVRRALAWTEGVGVDAVVVAAHAPDDGPLVAAARMSRLRARVVVTGFVPFALPRELAYEKELELRISRSSGPGRHDPTYEEGGLDYPLEHVRWTESRNVEAFLHLIREDRVRLAPLISLRLPLVEAPRAFGDDAEAARAVGILLEHPAASVRARSVPVVAVPRDAGALGIAVIGAGDFARGTLLPELAGLPGTRIAHVVAATGLSATEAARRHGAARAGTDPDEALADPGVGAVVIATRHDSHAELAARALRAGKHVFVEKPLSLSDEGIDDVESAARAAGRVLLVGFNRRFSPHVAAARRELQGRGPVAAAIRVAAAPLPPDHWLLDEAQGGGRLAGEGCHFLDLLSCLAFDADIASLDAVPLGPPGRAASGFALQVRFGDGSTGQVLYTPDADARLPKERVEAHAGGTTVTIDDFSSASVSAGGRSRRLPGSGKGHAEELAAFVAAVRDGRPPVPLAVTLRVARATLRARRMLLGAR